MSKRLEGKVAIVTGAGQGVGEGIATKFAHEGTRCVIADCNEEAGARVTDLEGRKLDLACDSGNWQRNLQAIGANPELHDQLLSILRATRAEAQDPYD